MEEDHLFELNYAVTLVLNGEVNKAKEHFAEFERIFEELDEESRNADPDVLEQRRLLARALKM